MYPTILTQKSGYFHRFMLGVGVHLTIFENIVHMGEKADTMKRPIFMMCSTTWAGPIPKHATC